MGCLLFFNFSCSTRTRCFENACVRVLRLSQGMRRYAVSFFKKLIKIRYVCDADSLANAFDGIRSRRQQGISIGHFLRIEKIRHRRTDIFFKGAAHMLFRIREIFKDLRKLDV